MKKLVTELVPGDKLAGKHGQVTVQSVNESFHGDKYIQVWVKHDEGIGYGVWEFEPNMTVEVVPG